MLSFQIGTVQSNHCEEEMVLAQPLKCSLSWTWGDFQLSSPVSVLQPFSSECWIIDRHLRFVFLKINTGLYFQTRISDTKGSELGWHLGQIYYLPWIVGMVFLVLCFGQVVFSYTSKEGVAFKWCDFRDD